MAFASFIIPVFKTEAFLPRCLDSLVAQTDGDIEAIVVDDCSPGDAARTPSAPYRAEEIVNRYDKRFRYIRQDKNRSTFQAKATGAKAATGDYIIPLDSDDYVLPGLVAAIKKEVANVMRHETGDERLSLNSQPSTLNSPTDLIVYQMVKEFEGKPYPVKYNHPHGHCTGEEALKKLLSGRIFMPVCGKAIRREIFLKAYEGLAVGPDFYLNFTDDLCWLVPILFNTKTVSFITYPGYRYWRHDESMTKDVLTPERIRSLAEQSQKSVAAVIAYAERLGVAPDTVQRIREQLYPTVRWLLRDMGQSRESLEAAYGPDLVAGMLRWDASAGGFLAKTLRHLKKFGIGATLREIRARARGVEI